MDFSIVPKRIGEVMENAEYGSEVYSVELGYETDYINSVIFNGVSPTLEFLERFAEITNTELEYLFGMVEYIDVEF